jgi:hypothetical protein
MATATTELSYTPTELRSYLPTGWSLFPGAAGRWDGDRGLFTVRVLDGAHMDWELQVAASAASRHGRIEALRRAVDVLFRERLG